MNRSKSIFVILLITLAFCFNAFSDYYQLAGKWVNINGPRNWPLLGVALDEATCDKVQEALSGADRRSFENMLEHYKIFRVNNGSSAMVLEVKLFERKAKVMVFTGLYQRESGWIPLEWLDGNYQRPNIKDFANKPVDTAYPVNEPFQWYRSNQLY